MGVRSTNSMVTIHGNPYRHAIFRNVFSDAVAQNLLSYHERVNSKSLHIGTREQVGEAMYSARTYTPTLLDIQTSPVAAFFSQSLRESIQDCLGVTANDCIMMHSHRHDAPSTNGIPHNDCGVVCFPHHGPSHNGFNIYQQDTGVIYSDDSRDAQPDVRKVARSIACIYHVGDANWQVGDGGETALYAMDQSTILKKVPPIHNSLFAFDTSPISQHGYLASPRKTRRSFIWWYHDEVVNVLDRHRGHFERLYRAGQEPWGRWTRPEVPKYTPPGYLDYSKSP